MFNQLLTRDVRSRLGDQAATTRYCFLIFRRHSAALRIASALKISSHYFVCAARAAILYAHYDTAIAYAATETIKVPHPSLRVAPIIFLLAGALTACSHTSEKSSAKPVLGGFGIDIAQMNTQERPGDAFYRYVNGTWLDNTEIPEDKSRYGSFYLLRDQSQRDVHNLLKELASTGTDDPTQQKVAELFATWMDVSTIESRGLSPLQPDLERIAAAEDFDDLMVLVGDINMASPIGFGIRPDPADTSRYIVFISQAGLGMGRDYYINDGPEYDNYRDAYLQYIETVLSLLGDPEPAINAEKIFALETALAHQHWTPAQRRNVQATYNPMDREDLKTLAPDIDWDTVLAGSGIGGTEHFVVGETTAISGGASLLASEPLSTWKSYLAYHRASDTAQLLPQDFDNARFNFYNRTLRGVEEQQERWKRGVSLVDHHLGEALGQVYVAKHFPPEHKAKMDTLVSNLLAAMALRLSELEWMDESTRAEALKKLSTFEPRIGYPARWRDYTALQIEPGKLFESVQNAYSYEWNRQIQRLDQPVDREEWFMSPPTVNAYYDPLKNQITFPAAILQPPFFDANADAAVNYGGIGAVIGHEIGHGFDDMGREFDEQGRIRNWWTDETAANFEAITTELGALYSAYCPIPGNETDCVNGQLTMGENIGDLGGLEMAYTAYRLSLNGEEAPVIDGFTGDQRFFMSWAQVWRGKTRDDALLNMLLTDPHSPESVRGEAPLRNIDSWYDAFDVSEEDALYLPPEDRVRVW